MTRPDRLNARLARDLTTAGTPVAWRIAVWIALSKQDDNLLASLAAEYCIASSSGRKPSVMAAKLLADTELP